MDGVLHDILDGEDLSMIMQMEYEDLVKTIMHLPTKFPMRRSTSLLGIRVENHVTARWRWVGFYMIFLTEHIFP